MYSILILRLKDENVENTVRHRTDYYPFGVFFIARWASRGSRKIVPIDCHKIEEKFWKGKDDIADEMDAGDCFCGLKWVENADCDEPTTTPNTTGKKKRKIC